MKKIIIFILAITMLFSINVFAEKVAGVPQLGITSNLFMNLFGLHGNDKVGILVVNEPVGKRDPLVWGKAANYPWVESLIFVFNSETMEYRYAAYSPSMDVMLKIHSKQPHAYSTKGFEKYKGRIQWIDLNEQYVMLDVYPVLTVHYGYYKELTENFETLENAKKNAEIEAKKANDAMVTAIAARDAKQVEYNEYKTLVDKGKKEYEDKLTVAGKELALTQTEVDKKGMALLTAISQRDAAEIEIEKLQQMVKDRDATIGKKDKRISDLESMLANSDKLLKKSKELEDPYLVRQSNLDRKITTPYLKLEGILNNSDVQNNDVVATGRATLGLKLTNKKTGLTYVLLEGFGSGNADEKWNAGGLMVISLPHRILEFKIAGQAGTDGAGTYTYEDMDGEYYGLINVAAKLNIPYEDSARFGIETGLETPTKGSGLTSYLNFDFELTPPNFPYLTFTIDQLSFAKVQTDEQILNRYKVSTGFNINWSAGKDKDPQWVGNLYSWFVRVNYQIYDNKTMLSVTDDAGFKVGLRIIYQ